ncbi:MAG: sugar ABC transporter permease [Chloroflexota bacterium]|nr:sugar ABC transporter permease [Chloroflexota bacterium]
MAVVERSAASVAAQARAPAAERGLAALWRRNATALLFMAPAAVMVVLFFVLPVVLTLGIGLTDMSTATGLSRWQWIGVDNFERIFTSRFTSIIFLNTVLYVVVTLAVSLLLGLAVALLSTHIDRNTGALFRALWLLPRISPSVVYALMWTWAAAEAPFGIINVVVAPFGVEQRPWLSTDPWLIVFLINGFVGASLGMLIFTSAIEGIPVDLVRAARVDGANAWQIVRRITLPLLKWPILFFFTYQSMSLLASYEYILLTTNGGPGLYGTEVWSLWAYHTALNSYFGNLQIGLGAAMAAVLVLMGLTVSFVLLRLFRFGDLVAEPRVEIT